VIIGTLAWFNESPAWLARTVASAARVCDHLVAVDGRYELLQHDMDWSPMTEAEAVLAAAEGAGLPLTLHIPRKPFAGNEVEKRNLLLQVAFAHAQPEDWIFVIDADEYVVHADPNIREIIASVEGNVITYELEEYLDPVTELGTDGGVARMMPLPNTWRVKLRCIYRALDGLQYVGTHFRVGGFVDGKWHWLYGNPAMEQAFDLRERLILRHENPRRTMMRRQQAANYYAARDELKIEDTEAPAPIA